MRSFPEYFDTAETRVVDLSPDGIDCIPVLGEHRYKRAGGSTVPHVHPGMIEIILCRRGANLSFDCNGKVMPFLPGTVFVAQPETPHFLRLYPKSLSTAWVWFRVPQSGGRVLGLSIEETSWLVGRLRGLPAMFAATSALGQSFRRLWQIHEDRSRGAVERRLLMRDAVMRLLLDVVESSSAHVGAFGSNRLAALIQEIRRDPSHSCSIDELANRAAMSVAKLTFCFRRETGLPPHAFIVFCRIARAKEMLSASRRSVVAIAHELGFPTAQHFATQFRRETGMSPMEWRARNSAPR